MGSYADILPNFIGYYFIYLGLGILKPQKELFEKGKLPAFAMAVLSFIDLFRSGNTNLLEGQLLGGNIWSMLVASTSSIINLYLFYIICRSIYELSEIRGLQELKEAAKARYMFYFIVSAISTFYIPFSLNLPQSFNSIMILIVFINLFSAFSIMMLFSKSKGLLAN